MTATNFRTSPPAYDLDTQIPLPQQPSNMRWAETARINTETGSTLVKPASPQLGAKPSTQTSVDNARGSFRVIVPTPLKETTPQQLPLLQRDYVDGCVLHLDPASVLAELIAGDDTVKIRLPRALFPDGVVFGQPFRLRLETGNGMRRPVVQLRQPDLARLREENETLARLVNDL